MLIAATDFTGIAVVLGGVAAVITATAALVTAVGTNRRLREVKAAVTTNNGIPMGAMVEHGYAMAAQLVPPEVRTDEQHKAVASLTEQEHATHAEGQAAGAPPPAAAPKP